MEPACPEEALRAWRVRAGFIRGIGHRGSRRRHKADQAHATGFSRLDTCSPALVALALGHREDVETKRRVQTVMAHIKVQALYLELHQTLRRVWPKAVARVAPLQHRWLKVTRSTSATIASLLELGWTPAAPTRWLAPSSNRYFDLDDRSATKATYELRDRLISAAKINVGKKASRHESSNGAEGGVDSAAMAKRMRRAERGGDAARYTTLALSAAAGLWPQERFLSAGLILEEERTCKRCNSAPETAHPRCW